MSCLTRRVVQLEATEKKLAALREKMDELECILSSGVQPNGKKLTAGKIDSLTKTLRQKRDSASRLESKLEGLQVELRRREEAAKMSEEAACAVERQAKQSTWTTAMFRKILDLRYSSALKRRFDNHTERKQEVWVDLARIFNEDMEQDAQKTAHSIITKFRDEKKFFRMFCSQKAKARQSVTSSNGSSVPTG